MPYTVSWPANTFLAEFTGIVTAAEVEAVNLAFGGDARMETVRYSIWDFSGASAIDMPRMELEDAAAFDKGVSEVRPVLKGALVATCDAIRRAIDTYLVTAGELGVGWDTRVFGSLAAARAWLEGDS